MGQVTRVYNAYCSEQGIQCTVTMDPLTHNQLFHLENVGDRLVRITHEGATRFLEPGEHVTLSTKEWYSLEQNNLPKIEALNGGL